jgi:hypothetical protein
MSPCAGLTGQLIMPVCRQYFVPDIPATSGEPACFRGQFFASLTGNVIHSGFPSMCFMPEYPAIFIVPDFRQYQLRRSSRQTYLYRLPATFPMPASGNIPGAGKANRTQVSPLP